MGAGAFRKLNGHVQQLSAAWQAPADLCFFCSLPVVSSGASTLPFFFLSFLFGFAVSPPFALRVVQVRVHVCSGSLCQLYWYGERRGMRAHVQVSWLGPGGSRLVGFSVSLSTSSSEATSFTLPPAAFFPVWLGFGSLFPWGLLFWGKGTA